MCPQFIWYWPYHACKYRAISVRICRIWEQMWVKHDWKAFILEESAVFSQILKLLRSLHFEGCVVRKRFHFLSSTLFLSAAVLLLVVEEVVLVKQQGGSALFDGGTLLPFVGARILTRPPPPEPERCARCVDRVHEHAPVVFISEERKMRSGRMIWRQRLNRHGCPLSEGRVYMDWSSSPPEEIWGESERWGGGGGGAGGGGGGVGRDTSAHLNKTPFTSWSCRLFSPMRCLQSFIIKQSRCSKRPFFLHTGWRHSGHLHASRIGG